MRRALTRPGLPARHRGAKGGFTLIELLVVITVIAILAGMILAAVVVARGAATRKVCQQLITQVAMNIEQYSTTYGEPPPEKYGTQAYSPECLVIFLGRGLYGGEKGRPAAQQRAIQAKRDFMTVKESFLSDYDENDYPELVDAWGLPIIYNRRPFTGPGGSTWSDSRPPLHNPTRYDLFSCGPLASRINALGGKLPNINAFDEAATQEKTGGSGIYLYKYEQVTVGRRSNEYIGNW